MDQTSLRPYYLIGGLIAIGLVITAAAGLLIEGLYRPFLSEPIVAFQFLFLGVAGFIGLVSYMQNFSDHLGTQARSENLRRQHRPGG